MSGFKEYDQYDALGLAKLIKKNEVSLVDICEEAISRIESLNPKLNAVVTPMFDLARRKIENASASGPDAGGPFAGVPFLLKDLIAAFAGVPLTSGSRACRNFIPDHDSELVRRFKKAGVVILGKTNTPEFGLVGYTEPELHGPTRNPWNTNRTPGGSSGGSAAAVAAGMVPIASGGDGGGSIRIPASYCGLFGLKPTRGRTPTGPDFGEISQGAVVEHIISRSVRDSAAMLDATCGPDIGAPYIIMQPERPYLEEIKREPGRLKIAFNVQSPVDTPVHPEYVQAVKDTALLLEKLGHRVDEAQPDFDGGELARSYLSMCYAEVTTLIDSLSQMMGKKITASDVEISTWTLNLLGRSSSIVPFMKTKHLWGQAARAMGRFHQKYDVYLTPTNANPPAKIGELLPKAIERAVLKAVNTLRLERLLKLSGVFDKIVLSNLARTPFTMQANFTGQPAMSVPLHWTSDGLPCGMQFIASFGDEATLFRLAAQLEGEKPWFHKRPDLGL